MRYVELLNKVGLPLVLACVVVLSFVAERVSTTVTRDIPTAATETNSLVTNIQPLGTSSQPMTVTHLIDAVVSQADGEQRSPLEVNIIAPVEVSNFNANGKQIFSFTMGLTR